MKLNFSNLSILEHALIVMVFSLFTVTVYAQEDLNVNGSRTINGVEEFHNVNLTSNNSVLNVYGTLIVYGNIEMSGNKSEFNMGPEARVIVFGDFNSSNQINISVSSYLIIHGDFSKGGSTSQGDLDVKNGNIYIFGNVNNWGEEFTTCSDYEGDTNEITEEECDYGTENDYVDNQENFPEDLRVQNNCFNISYIENQSIELGSDALLQIDPVNNINYQWQQRSSANDEWQNKGLNQPTYLLKDLDLTDSGLQVRVVLKPTSTNSSNCKISISNIATIKVLPRIVEHPKNVTSCSGNQVNFSVVTKGSNLNYKWQRTDSGNSDNFFSVEENVAFQGRNTPNLVVNTEKWLDNKKFRVVITDANGNTKVSDAALLRVNQSPQGIYTQPENQVVCEGNNIYFQTYTSNDDKQWQVSEDGGISWIDIANNEFYQNVNSQKLDILKAPISFNNNLYRIKVYNENCSVYSNSARLEVNPDPIYQQPQNVTVRFGENAFIEAGVVGNNLSFQWQTYSSNWYNINNDENYSGTKTPILKLITVGYWPEDGARFRLLVTNSNGCVSISKEAILNIGQDTCLTSINWIGAVNNDWNNTNNWSCNTLPTLETDVLIPAGLSNYPEMNTGVAAKAKNITIEQEALVIVNNYELQIAGSINNSGAFNAVNGNITFIGNSPQTIPAETFVDNRIKNLTLNNSSGVISQGVLEITGILKAQSGNFDTGNSLTLISDEVQTALIDGSGTGQVLGTVKMQRYLDNSFGYKYFSSPFQNSTVGDFAPYIDLNESFPNFYRYNENREDVNGNDATGWEVYTNSTSNLNPIEGYALNFGDSVVEKTVEISGTVNNGTYSRKLSNHNGIYTKGFNLVGNPYPSPIDWNSATGWTKTNVDDAIYFFTAGSTDRYTGTYTSYVNGVQSDDGKSSNIIPSMQGFFVHVSNNIVYPVEGTLGMTNAVRIINFSQPFLKQSVKQAPALIRITAGFEGEKSVDPTVIYFESNATTGFEKDLDAHKLMNTAVNVPNFYSFTPKRDKLAISAISNAIGSEPERIALGIKSEKTGVMVISLKDVKNLSAGAYIYLVDEEKRIVQDLNSDPEYRFQAQEGEINSRFYLVFSNTRISDPAVIYDEPFSVETQNGQVLVRMNLKEGERGPLQISTVTGQIINVLEVTEKEVVEVQGIRSTGVYFISYLSGKETFTKKVLVKK